MNKTLRPLLFSISIVLLGGLTSCGYPLKTQPLLQGSLEGNFYEDAYYEPSDEGSPIALETTITEFSPERYTFEGTFFWQGRRYRAVGFEETSPNLEYLKPQAYLLAGSAEVRLEQDDTLLYLLCGESRYGVGGGFTPDREKPVATFAMYAAEKGQCFAEPYLEPIGYLRLE